MITMHITFSKNEKALPLENSKGSSKGRIHLYDYKGDKGKDPYALAATLLKKLPRFHLPYFKKRYVILKSGGVIYKINKKSLCKRLKIKANLFEKSLRKDRVVEASSLFNMVKMNIHQIPNL